jgi:RNA polymerase subunit RPABC4/transcription elongation factor Spt4
MDDAETLLYRKTCKECHTLERPDIAKPPVIPTSIMKERWMDNAVFAHTPHQMVKCQECHAGANSPTEGQDTFKILMPESVSIERRQMLEVYGAEIILTPGPEGSNGAVRRAQALAEEHPEWAFLYQYGNDANPRAHYEGTGPEIWRDCEEVTHFVAGLGTSGTLMGTGTYLKEQNPDIKVIAIEPPIGELVEGLRLLEDDSLVYDFTVTTDRLLLPLEEGKVHRDAFAIINVTVKSATGPFSVFDFGG